MGCATWAPDMGLLLTTLLQIRIKLAEWMGIDLSAFSLKAQCDKTWIDCKSIYFSLKVYKMGNNYLL